MVTFYHSFQNQSSQSSPDSVRIQGPSRSSSGHLYPVSSVKEHNRKGGKCKISRVLQLSVSSPQASPKVEVSNRPKQAQHLLVEGSNETPESIRASLISGEWVPSIDLSHLPSTQLKEIPDSVLRVDNKSGEVRTETYSGVLVRGLRIPSRFSRRKTHSRQMAQTSGFDPMSQVKTCFDCKIFDVANWVAWLNGEMVPEGRLHEALSVSF